MFDKKPTDKEIKKALECCSNGDSCAKECPLDDEHNSLSTCTSRLSRLALDLTNRLEAKNEELENQLAKVKKELKEYKAGYKMACTERNEFLEQLESAEIQLENNAKACEVCNTKHAEKTKQAQSETMSKFAEGIVRKLDDSLIKTKGIYSYDFLKDIIKEQLKDMAGEH